MIGVQSYAIRVDYVWSPPPSELRALERVYWLNHGIDDLPEWVADEGREAAMRRGWIVWFVLPWEDRADQLRMTPAGAAVFAAHFPVLARTLQGS